MEKTHKCYALTQMTTEEYTDYHRYPR